MGIATRFGSWLRTPSSPDALHRGQTSEYMVPYMAMKRTLRFVCDQSLHGHHYLFDATVIRSAFDQPLRRLGPASVAAAERLLDELEDEDDLQTQRDCIARASREVQETLVHLYFDFLYRYLARRSATLH